MKHCDLCGCGPSAPRHKRKDLQSYHEFEEPTPGHASPKAAPPTAKPACFLLYKTQLAELRRLAQEPQHTHGKGRARTQNNLVRWGFAQLYDGELMCAITSAGRAALKEQG